VLCDNLVGGCCAVPDACMCMCMGVIGAPLHDNLVGRSWLL